MQTYYSAGCSKRKEGGHENSGGLHSNIILGLTTLLTVGKFEKLEPGIFFTPLEYKKPTGRPPRARKDCLHLNKTNVQHQCSSCGGLGHSFQTCDGPSTQFRFEHHNNKAVAWTKAFDYYDKSAEV